MQMKAAKRKQVRTAQGRKVHRVHLKPKPEQQAIVVRPAPPRPWVLSKEEVELYKNIVCKGASDEEFKFCLTVAQRYHLDPFKRQIYFVPRRDSEEEGKKNYIPIVSIDGLQHIAARDHRDYGSISKPQYGQTIKVEWQWKGKGEHKKLDVPEWASVEVRKKGFEHPTMGEVRWNEIYPNIDYSPLVRRMPFLMLAKCARAQAIRIAYPSTGGLLIPEETHGPEFQFTPEGRAIEAAPAAQGEVIDVNPHEEAYERREQEGLKKLNEEQRKIVESRIADSKATTMQYRLIDVADPSDPRWVISGPTDLKKKYRELLEPFVDREKQRIIVDAKGLGTLIARFEGLKESFKEVGAVQREPGE
jgi:phage recombination protein Bet